MVKEVPVIDKIREEVLMIQKNYTDSMIRLDKILKLLEM